MSRSRILVVDDDASVREALGLALGRDCEVQAAASGAAGLEAVRLEPPDLVLLDVGLPDLSGIEVLGQIRTLLPRAVVIMITGRRELALAVEAMKLGAYDYVSKPLHLESLQGLIRNALESIRLRREVEELQARTLKDSVPCFIGESDSIRDVMELISKVAVSHSTPVLILGETGTGKELIARAIHQRSQHFQGPLVSVNCAAIPAELIESELFGYDKGAFTGARTSGKRGLIEQAADGTLFLDEVGDLSLDAQAKLLRFLESGEFYRVGGTRTLKVRTRVISATNKDVERLMEQGLLRADLYYRLGVVKLQVPSLNQRPTDILLLARHFLGEFAREFHKPDLTLTPQAQQALLEHKFRGNVRELKNVIERAVLVATGPGIGPLELGLEPGGAPDRHPGPTSPGPAPATLGPDGVDLQSLLEELERSYFRQALCLAKGNESAAARLLHLNHHTFRYRRRKLEPI